MSKDSKSLRICKYFFGRRRAAEAKKSPTAPPRSTRRSAAQAPGSKASPAEQPDRKREEPREEEKDRTERNGLCKAGRVARSREGRAKRIGPHETGWSLQSGKLCAERPPRRRDKTEERYPHPAGTAPLQCRDTRPPPREPDVRRGLPSVQRPSPDGGRLNASSPVRGRS